MEALELLFWIITIVLNWRMFICVAVAGTSGFILIHHFGGNPWTWTTFSVLIIVSAIIGYLWEKQAD